MGTTNLKWYFDTSLPILSELDFILVIDNLQYSGEKPSVQRGCINLETRSSLYSSQ